MPGSWNTYIPSRDEDFHPFRHGLLDKGRLTTTMHTDHDVYASVTGEPFDGTEDPKLEAKLECS